MTTPDPAQRIAELEALCNRQAIRIEQLRPYAPAHIGHPDLDDGLDPPYPWHWPMTAEAAHEMARRLAEFRPNPAEETPA